MWEAGVRIVARAALDDTTRPSWQRRRVASFAVHATAYGGPVLVAALSSIAVSTQLAVPNDRVLLAARTVGVVLVSSVVYVVADRFSRRLLPLASLLRMSLLFPQRAPSRRSLARLAISRRRMTELVEHARTNGVDPDLETAATQVVMLATAIAQHDRRGRGHAERVRAYADLLGESLGLSPVQRQKLQWVALLHDVGKIAVPVEILEKRGPLSLAEREIMDTHAQVGAAIVAPLRPFLGSWLDAVEAHHERWDGHGYPNGLARTDIPPAAAILAVCDAFDAMTSHSPAMRPRSLAAARGELERNAGTQFAPDVVRHFLGLSLGRLRTAMGPVAALSHVPLLGAIGQAPATVTAGVTSAAGGAMSFAGSVTTVAVLSTAMATAGAMAGPEPTPAAADTARVLAVEARRVAEPGAPLQMVALPTLPPASTNRSPTTTRVSTLAALDAGSPTTGVAGATTGATGATGATGVGGTGRATTTISPAGAGGSSRPAGGSSSSGATCAATTTTPGAAPGHHQPGAPASKGRSTVPPSGLLPNGIPPSGIPPIDFFLNGLSPGGWRTGGASPATVVTVATTTTAAPTAPPAPAAGCGG
jgi:HD-GYP domain-containing protein (c-di-GMP phosphodiesterase class II)